MRKPRPAPRLRLPRVIAAGLVVAATSALPARSAGEDDTVQRGREVYIAEGCINCHSQYIRPQVAADVERWGPALPLTDLQAEQPVLAGNRRQGPDLANVGLRRNAEWNRLHLLAPRRISPGSLMPAYAHLFAPGDSRGPDLVAYLASLGAGRLGERMDFIAHWQPRGPEAARPDPEHFARLCSACHGPTGRGDGPLAPTLALAPPDWSAGPRRTPPPGEDRPLFLRRIIKFGLPGTAMAGHEYLPDDVIAGLARFVQDLQSPTASARSR